MFKIKIVGFVLKSLEEEVEEWKKRHGSVLTEFHNHDLVTKQSSI